MIHKYYEHVVEIKCEVYPDAGDVWCSCPRSFSSPRFIFCINETEGNSSWREISERPAAESATSNERLVQVSNNRITSFVDFQKISGYPSAHSAVMPEPWPFTDGEGVGPRIGTPPLPPQRWSVHLGSWHFHRSTSEKNSLIHMENLILTFLPGANQDDARLSLCNHGSWSTRYCRGGMWIHLICQS